MFISIEPHEQGDRTHSLAQMYRHRGEVFFHQRKWDVDIDHRGWEKDKYDELVPLYLLSIDGSDNVLSSMRVMPTTGPNLTSDVFYELLPTKTVIRSPLIWEVTRFALNPFVKHSYKRGVALSMWELLIGANELALKSGIKQYVAVFDSAMERYYRLCGWRPEIIGRKKVRKNEEILLGLWDVNEETSIKMSKISGLKINEIYPDILKEYAA